MVEAITNNTPLKITVYPEKQESISERNLSPYQQRMAGGYDVVNNEFFGTDSFKDVLDTINPLQQLPVVSTIYRQMSGDTISTGARLAGGALLGGAIGFAIALANEMISSTTGKDIGSHLYATISDKYKASEDLSANS